MTAPSLTLDTAYSTSWRGVNELTLIPPEERAEWTAAYINDLPDSSFAYIEPGGEKDEDGKTTPRSLRHFPHHNAEGAIDLPHLRNALARAPQSPFGAKAMPHLQRHAKTEGVGDRDEDSQHHDLERRAWPMAEVRVASGDEGPRITGYAAVFNQSSEPISDLFGTFIERIRRGAFAKTLQEADVRALVNHDPNYVLGRNKSGTLSLRENTKGLQVEIEPPDTQWARDLMTSMKRGDVSQMSFAFRVVPGKEKWTEGEDGMMLRDIQEVMLYDVSVVTFPAYPQTSAVARALWDEAGIDVERVTSVLLRTRAGLPLSCADSDCLRAATVALTAQLPQEPAPATPADVSLLRAELDLMERTFALS